jgi:hypothetical protein
MPTPTYTLIASSTVGSGGSAAIDFTSIPSTYTDLCIVASVRFANSFITQALAVKFNTLTTNQSVRLLYGTGSAAGSYTDTTVFGSANANNSTANTFGNFQLYIPNYAGSNNKSMSIDAVVENNATASSQDLNAALWSASAAINAISLYNYGSTTTLMQYSTAYLYGIVSS